MQTIQKQTTIDEALAWLEAEYPKGVDLVYVDYRDRYEDMTTLQDVLKGEMDDNDEWQADVQYEGIRSVMDEYEKQHEGVELSDEVRDAMQDWLFNHDTSNPTKDLLKNTGSKLFYIETLDYFDEDKANVSELVKKYAKTPEQKKEIQSTINEQFYGSPVSFYFYASALDVHTALQASDSKYITINGAYFSTIDRVQGSNWLGNEAIFNITIPREQAIQNIYLDEAKDNGYGWNSIAGQSSYDEATIFATNTKKAGTILIESETSEAQKREARLQANWEKTKKCTLGDMNYSRHTGKKEYINSFPCGNKCEACGTFWID